MEKPGKLSVIGPIQSKEDFRVYDIPMEFEGFPITSIEDEAFSGCAEIEHIIIPNTVSTIGESAFEFCRNLSTINIPDVVTSTL